MPFAPRVLGILRRPTQGAVVTGVAGDLHDQISTGAEAFSSYTLARLITMLRQHRASFNTSRLRLPCSYKIRAALGSILPLLLGWWVAQTVNAKGRAGVNVFRVSSASFCFFLGRRRGNRKAQFMIPFILGGGEMMRDANSHLSGDSGEKEGESLPPSLRQAMVANQTRTPCG
jgi:hypothetical protein